jgi:hypothetical protein
MTTIPKDARDIPKEVEYEGLNMQAIAVLFDFLSDRLKEAQVSFLYYLSLSFFLMF